MCETSSNKYISIVDFLKGSKTKYLRFDMQNFRGEVIDSKIIKADDLIYSNTCVKAKYPVDDKLSAIMVPERYKLFVYLIDQIINEDGTSKEIYNKCLTENGISIQVK